MSPDRPDVLAADRVLARPGHARALGPSVIALGSGRIDAITQAAYPASGTGKLAMPALCNAHDHGRGLRSLAVGAADDALEAWIPQLAAEPVSDPYLRAAVAFARMAQSGICAANHCHNTQDGPRLVAEAEGVARAARDVGIKVSFAVPFFDRNRLVYGDPSRVLPGLGAEAGAGGMPTQDRLAQFDDIVSLENPNFMVQYGPVGPQWVSDAAMRAIAAHAGRTGRRVHLHLFETRLQKEWADAQYRHGYVRFLDELGLLNDRLTVAHAVWMDTADAALLAERGVIVSLNASSNLRLRSGMPPIGRCLDAGIAFAIGLDGMALDDDEDMLREIRLLRHMAGGLRPGLEGSGLADDVLFDAALIRGRQSILGADGGGVLAQGAPADILLLDYAEMVRDAIDDDLDPATVLLTRMARNHVTDLVVDGRRIVADGRCCSADLPGLQAELHAQARAARTGRTRGQTGFRAALQEFYRCGCHREPPPGRTADPPASAPGGMEHATPRQLRRAIRSGQFRGFTNLLAGGYVQANIMILPQDMAEAFASYCRHNSAALPVIAQFPAGATALPDLAEDLDIRTDIGAYTVFRDGVASVHDDIVDFWRDDFVTFAIGCSFSFEAMLCAGGVRLRHLEEGDVSAMYVTTIETQPVAPFAGPLVVSMRAMTPGDAIRATVLSSQYRQFHGAPIHLGSPAAIGINDLAESYGGHGMRQLRPDEIPVFWPCGATAQLAAMRAKLPICITHHKAHMLVTDRLITEMT
jgi:uncharacterized protein YcsI (UPF0317 family)/cytosine/adenosine deaminase-related metal-dependent hydrolase